MLPEQIEFSRGINHHPALGYICFVTLSWQEGPEGFGKGLTIQAPCDIENGPNWKSLKDFCRDLREQVTKLEREYWETQI